jgi:hypothetical protein
MPDSSPAIGHWTSILANAGITGSVQGPQKPSGRRSGPRAAKAGWGLQEIMPAAGQSTAERVERDRVRLRELAEEAPDLYDKASSVGLSQAYRQLRRRRERDSQDVARMIPETKPNPNNNLPFRTPAHKTRQAVRHTTTDLQEKPKKKTK